MKFYVVKRKNFFCYKTFPYHQYWKCNWIQLIIVDVRLFPRIIVCVWVNAIWQYDTTVIVITIQLQRFTNKKKGTLVCIMRFLTTSILHLTYIQYTYTLHPRSTVYLRLKSNNLLKCLIIMKFCIYLLKFKEFQYKFYLYKYK